MDLTEIVDMRQFLQFALLKRCQLFVVEFQDLFRMCRKNHIYLPCNLRNILLNPFFEFLRDFEVLRVLLQNLYFLESADLDGWPFLPKSTT